MKEMAAPDTPSYAIQQIIASRVSESSAPNRPAPAAPAVSTSPQPSGAQSLIPQSENGEDSNGEAGSNAPQQTQDDSPTVPSRPIVASPDSKVKPADAKLDDSASQVGLAVAPGGGQDRAAAVTSFVDTPSGDRSRALSGAPPEASTPFHDTAEVLRNSEPDLPAAPQSRVAPAQEILIRIAQPDALPVDLRVVERSGQVHVDVRTTDGALQTSLRQDLGTLTSSLERVGYHSEIFTPSFTLSRGVASAQMSSQDDLQDPSQNHGGGDFPGGRRQQQQPKRPGTWFEELDDQQ